jgi:hypothetical protein
MPRGGRRPCRNEPLRIACWEAAVVRPRAHLPSDVGHTRITRTSDNQMTFAPRSCKHDDAAEATKNGRVVSRIGSPRRGGVGLPAGTPGWRGLPGTPLLRLGARYKRYAKD